MDETLSCVQSDIMAVHRHQMAMPKDESTSERAARCVVDARQHKGYVVTWLSAVEDYRKTTARYAGILETVQHRCKALDAGQAQCSSLVFFTGRLETALRAMILTVRKEVIDPERCALHALQWSTREDLLSLCRKLYLSAGILMYKHHARAEMDPERTSRRGNILWHLSPHSRPASRTQPKCMSRRVGVLRRKGYACPQRPRSSSNRC